MPICNSLFTPDSLTGTAAFTIMIPDDQYGKAAFMFAMDILCQQETWLEVGTVTPADIADYWTQIMYLFTSQL